MTLDELNELYKYINIEMYDEYDNFQCYGIQITNSVNVNIIIDTDNGEIIEFEAETDSWSYPEEHEEGNHVIRLESDSIKYLPRALEFVINPLDMSMNVLEEYIKEVRKFMSKFLPVLEENNWHCDFEYCLSSFWAEQSIEPWFSFQHKYNERICFTYNIWEGKITGFDSNDINSLTIPQFRDKLHAFMERFMLFDDEHEALVQSLKRRSSEVK